MKLRHDQETKDSAGGDVLSRVFERGWKKLEQVRKEKLQAEEETHPVNKELEPLGKPELQTVADGQAVDKGVAPAKREPPSDTKKVAALQKQVDAL